MNIHQHMYSLWWSNHIVPAHVSKVAKNVAWSLWKTLQDCISVYMLWQFEIWENHFNSYIIITVWWGLSPLRYILQLPHLLEYTLAIIYKAFWSFCFYFSFRAYHAWAYKRERKEIPNYISLNITILLCWSMQMLFMIGGL